MLSPVAVPPRVRFAMPVGEDSEMKAWEGCGLVALAELEELAEAVGWAMSDALPDENGATEGVDFTIEAEDGAAMEGTGEEVG